MLDRLAKLFQEPESGTVKFSFIALDENDEPYEDVATMPWHDEFVAASIEAKFRSFMLLRKHLVLEITIQEVIKK